MNKSENVGGGLWCSDGSFVSNYVRLLAGQSQPTLWLVLVVPEEELVGLMATVWQFVAICSCQRCFFLLLAKKKNGLESEKRKKRREVLVDRLLASQPAGNRVRWRLTSAIQLTTSRAVIGSSWFFSSYLSNSQVVVVLNSKLFQIYFDNPTTSQGVSSCGF